jgi:Tfp pilus assembly PilM family ATPase
VGEIYDGGAEAKQELIVVAVAQATRDAYMDMARRGGLYVVAISIEAYAIVNCFARQFHRTSGSTGVVMFIDIGAESTQVVIAHDNSIVFARNLLMGCKQLDPLTNELAKCLRYHETAFRDGGVQTIIFSGGGAYDMDICRVIAKRLNIRAQIGNPLVDIDIAKGFRTNAGLDLGDPIPDWAVAVGLSLGAMETENTRERCLPAETRI